MSLYPLLEQFMIVIIGAELASSTAMRAWMWEGPISWIVRIAFG
jgi:hypothetical protein